MPENPEICQDPEFKFKFKFIKKITKCYKNRAKPQIAKASLDG